MSLHIRIHEVYEIFEGNMIKWVRVGDEGPFEIYSIRRINEPDAPRQINEASEGYLNRIKKYEEEGNHKKESG
jgi:hypothetical protein